MVKPTPFFKLNIMILKVNYNKSTGDITVFSDEPEVTVEVNADETTDNATELDFEVALDLSSYQELFNDDFIDGDNNE